MKNRLLIHHARQIVQVCSGKQPMLSGKDETKEIVVLSSDSEEEGVSLVVGPDGIIKGKYVARIPYSWYLVVGFSLREWTSIFWRIIWWIINPSVLAILLIRDSTGSCGWVCFNTFISRLDKTRFIITHLFYFVDFEIPQRSLVNHPFHMQTSVSTVQSQSGTKDASTRMWSMHEESVYYRGWLMDILILCGLVTVYMSSLWNLQVTTGNSFHPMSLNFATSARRRIEKGMRYILQAPDPLFDCSPALLFL